MGKSTLPGRKQVFRRYRNQTAAYDVIGRHDELLPGSPLLSPVMLAGRRNDAEAVDLTRTRSYAKEAIEALPLDHRSLAPPVRPYEVKISPKLLEYEQGLRDRLIAASKDGERR
jgi:nicotinate phosphoribosyltransferase